MRTSRRRPECEFGSMGHVREGREPHAVARSANTVRALNSHETIDPQTTPRARRLQIRRTARIDAAMGIQKPTPGSARHDGSFRPPPSGPGAGNQRSPAPDTDHGERLAPPRDNSGDDGRVRRVPPEDRARLRPTLTNPDLGQNSRQFGWKRQFGDAGSGQVRGRVGGREISPPLERALPHGFDAHDLGIQDDPAAADPVVAPDLPQFQYALAGLHHPLDHPVDASSGQDIGFPLRPHSRGVVVEPPFELLRAAALPLGHRLDGLGPHGEFHQIQVTSGHGSSLGSDEPRRNATRGRIPCRTRREMTSRSRLNVGWGRSVPASGCRATRLPPGPGAVTPDSTESAHEWMPGFFRWSDGKSLGHATTARVNSAIRSRPARTPPTRESSGKKLRIGDALNPQSVHATTERVNSAIRSRPACTPPTSESSGRKLRIGDALNPPVGPRDDRARNRRRRPRRGFARSPCAVVRLARRHGAAKG